MLAPPTIDPSQLVIEMVLGTDMKSHFAIISHFRAIHRLGDSATVAANLRGGGGVPSVARSMARRSQCSGYCGSVVSDASGIEVGAGFRVWAKALVWYGILPWRGQRLCLFEHSSMVSDSSNSGGPTRVQACGAEASIPYIAIGVGDV